VQFATPATPGTPQRVIPGLAPADAPERIPCFFPRSSRCCERTH
jgi:hypothetical protein